MKPAVMAGDVAAGTCLSHGVFPKGDQREALPWSHQLIPGQDHWLASPPAQPKLFGLCCRPNFQDVAMGPHQLAVTFISPFP